MRTRTVTKTRLVPHTVDGKTELVLDRYQAEEPRPPRDWDRGVRTAVTTLATVLVCVSVLWSTASIGDLLSLAVIPAAAYGAALAFDATWIMCMAVEWLSRYDRRRARAARWAGHLALLIAMGAVAVHGFVKGHPEVGVVGALVSALAKGGWTVAMTVHARPLDDRTAQWVEKQRAALDGQMAMIPIRRALQRSQGVLAAEAHALATPDTDPDSRPDTDADGTETPDTHPDATVRTLHPGALTVVDAVRTAVSSGIHDPDAVLRYVRQTADPGAKPDTVSRYLRNVRRTS